jgi:hypothetical protein
LIFYFKISYIIQVIKVSIKKVKPYTFSDRWSTLDASRNACSVRPEMVHEIASTCICLGIKINTVPSISKKNIISTVYSLCDTKYQM